jgi:cell division protein ZapA
LENFVSIELFGQKYTFQTEAEADDAKEIADFLASEVAKIETKLEGNAARVNKIAIMIMAALNISNEYIEMKKNYSDVLMDISKRSSRLIYDLNSIVN